MPRFPRVALLSPPDASTGTTPDAASSSSDAVRRALAPRGVELVSPEAADVLLALPGAVLSPALADTVAAGIGLVAVGPVTGLESLHIAAATAQGRAVEAKAETAWPDEDLLARTDPGSLAVTTSYEAPDLTALLRAGGATVAAHGRHGEGRVVVLGVEPDDAAAELVVEAVHHAARRTTRPTHEDPAALDADWQALKAAVTALQTLQAPDGAVLEPADHAQAGTLVTEIETRLQALAPRFPHDAEYLAALAKDLDAWVADGFGVPDFYDSMVAFAPASQRRDGVRHLVLFPMYTQNGSRDRRFEAVLIEVIWPDFVADLEAGAYSNKLFLPIRFLDFTDGYDTHSAVLFPETVAMRAVPEFTWGGIFADREAARFRRVVSEAARVTRLALPPDAARMLADQALTEETFVMWDLIHDRTHMRGDLPFDPFMIKQRMPYFLYSLEELRCDLTAFREAVKLEGEGVPHARLVQYAVIFDRIFRFSITGARVRNYDGLGGQLLFAWLHQARVLHWTDNRLTIEWERVADEVLALGQAIEDLYWRSIDRPKMAHWLAAYELVSGVVEPHPASVWARGKDALPLTGPLKGLTDEVLDDEFPLSMFFEALSRKMGDVIESTSGITG